ncbi:DotA/TraY family protein [Ochrobactrum teleogrylli]|uniref:DotA/TraY family protein n=1 Tax=Ochrobactrum teleogrylli TaxID=2479765 RepID=A0ABY2Y4V3_9HYPH|nr:DotA/TraY family protein [[Ochrobactrum] teleogrylli]TNV15848.1 hypothetical protein FIC94_11210 [[Ochrobactrum] teleogrylli]
MAIFTDLLREPSQHNIAWSWVTTLIPTDVSTPFGYAIGAFNSILVYLGALAVIWAVLQGIIHSAYTGKVLGDKFHQIWAPLRVFVGFGLLLPLGASFASGHYLLRDVVARAGINFADNIANVWFDGAQKMPMVPPTKNGLELVLDIYESEICATFKNFMQEKHTYLELIRPTPAMGYRDDKATEWRWGSCGTIKMPMLEGHTTLNLERQIAVGKIVLAARNDVKPFASFIFDTSRGIKSQQQAIAFMNSGLLPKLLDRVKSLANQYDTENMKAVEKDLAAESQGQAIRDKLKESLKQQGFISIGMYFVNLSTQSQQVLALTDVKHTRNVLQRDADGKGQYETAKEAIKAFRLSLMAEEAEIEVSSQEMTFNADEDSNILTKIINKFSRPLQEWAMSKGKKDANDSTVDQIRKSDPILDQIESGHWFITIAGGMLIAAYVPIIAAYTFAGDVAGMDGAALWSMIWLTLPISSLGVVGILRAYVQPIIPFISIMIFASTWLIGLIEVVIQLGVWALSWLKMDGDEFMHRGSELGSKIIYQVFLMPALGVLSYAASFVLLPMVVGTVEVLWAKAFYSQTGGYPVGITALITSFAMITFLTLYLTMHVFSQILTIPQRVIMWAGGGQGSDFGDKGMALAAATAVAATMGRGMPGLPKISTPKGSSDSSGEGENGGGKRTVKSAPIGDKTSTN